MKVVVAIDSFKGSLTSIEGGNAVADGIKRVYPDAEIFVRPIADGGEGTVDALVEGMGGIRQGLTVTGPLGESVECEYGIIAEDSLAVIEMSAAAGITLVPDEKRNPLNTTTYGVGEIIKDAISRGCRKFIVGIGGSATNDGGIGMLQALGFGVLDKNGEQVSFGAKGIADICSISTVNVLPELSECTFNVACDVKNPLCGENGCSAVYGPQKGADKEMIAKMDAWLESFADLAKESFPHSNKNAEGAGAAGGLGFAFLTFLGGNLTGGIELVLKETKLDEYVKDADIVITGEGRLDFQTVMGKAPSGVANIAKKYGKSVIAFSGAVTKEATVCNEHGIDAFFPILRRVCTLQEAMATYNAYANMTDTAEQVFRTIKTFSK
ncbi:MAG: glycerate kinase [Clostridia bacterium]|nr:glycerate kinase [Clostridia bacterium]